MPEFKALVRAALNNLDLAVWAIGRDGTILLSEGKVLQKQGVEPGQLVGSNAWELYSGFPDFIDGCRRALAGEELTASTVNGGATTENRYAALRDAKGEVVGVVGVSIDITDQLREQKERERQASILKEQAELLDLAHDAILARTIDGKITYWNRGAERMYGYLKVEAIGERSFSLLKMADGAALHDIEKELIDRGYWEGEVVQTTRDEVEIVVATRWVLKCDARANPLAVLEINTDITARKKAEAEEAHTRRQEEIIRAQALAIAELSTPLIPISEDILVMPLIGVMDSNRAQQVMDALLNGLAASRGRFAIIDITGVAVVDTQVANALMRAANAARLLGSEVILTGIRPEVAQTLVALDANLRALTTRGTLQSGIAYAMDTMKRRRANSFR